MRQKCSLLSRVKQQNAWRIKEPEVKFEFAVDVVDVVLCEGDCVVEHVLELGQHVRDLPHDHRQGGDTGVRPGCYVGALNWDMSILQIQFRSIKVLSVWM